MLYSDEGDRKRGREKKLRVLNHIDEKYRKLATLRSGGPNASRPENPK